MSKPSSSSQPNRPSTQTPSHRNDIKRKILNGTTKNKSPKFLKVSSTIKCYKCQGYRHLNVSCPSLIRITIIDGTPTEATEPEFDVYIFEGKDSKTNKEPTSDDVGLNYINQTPSTHLSVVRFVPSQLAEKDDWRKNDTLHTFTKIGEKNCKVIVDSKSCINAISSKLCEHLGLEI